ncbi:MAG: hypothetical protein JO312_00925 [Hyphomicrobiales bacterium]|nr:hypothetical protein [Hyphomicrobiales bacterium]
MVHVVMMVMIVVVVMMMVVVHLMGHRGGGGCWRGLLGDGIAREADRESGGGDKALDHRNLSCCRKDPSGLRLQFAAICLNSK